MVVMVQRDNSEREEGEENYNVSDNYGDDAAKKSPLGSDYALIIVLTYYKTLYY